MKFLNPQHYGFSHIPLKYSTFAVRNQHVSLDNIGQSLIHHMCDITTLNITLTFASSIISWLSKACFFAISGYSSVI